MHARAGQVHRGAVAAAVQHDIAAHAGERILDQRARESQASVIAEHAAGFCHGVG